MKMTRLPMMIGLALLAGVAEDADAQLLETQTYQGRLESGGAGAIGAHQIRYRVFDAPAGGAQLAEQIRTNIFGASDNGLFTFDDLDFGGAFDSGEDRWIETSVREGVAGAWTVLGPRQPVTAAPTAGVARRLTLPFADTKSFLDGQDMLMLTADSPVFGVHTGHFVHSETVAEWVSAALIAESSTHFGIIGSGAPASAGVAGTAYIDGSTGVRAERGPGNATGMAMFVWDLATGNDSSFGTPTHSAQFTGDAQFFGEVQITGEEIDSTETLDEPGVASSTAEVQTDPPLGSFGAIVSRTITAPGPGYIIAIASSELEHSHTTGTSSVVYIGVSDSPTAVTGSLRFNNINSAAPSGLYSTCVSDQHVYPVAGGSQTFYLTAQQFSGTGATFYNAQITLIYVPTAYGTVSAEEAGGGDAFARAGVAARGPLTHAEIVAEQIHEERRAMDEMIRRQAEIDRLVAEQRSALAALRRTSVSE